MIVTVFYSVRSISITKQELTGSKYLSILRKEKIFNYDSKLYPLRDAVQAILEKNTGEKITDMHYLHEMNGMSETAIDKAKMTISLQQMRWNQERGRLTIHCVEKYHEFDQIYQNFIREYIGPSVGGGKILHQRAPTLRINFPSNILTTVLHNDKDYHHQPSELNFWLSLCSVSQNNSLWLESEPNLGDWHSLTMEYGQVCRFYGNLCRHFTTPNDSGKTRVSIDFRVVSDFSGNHDPNFDRGVPRGSKARYQKRNDIGGYYDEIRIPMTPTRIITY